MIKFSSFFCYHVAAFGLLLLTAIPATAECVGNLTDDFEDGLLTPLWVESSTGGCGSVSETGGALVLNKLSGCTGGAVAVMNSPQFEVCGDFDISVDYQLPNFSVPGSNSRWTSLSLNSVSTGQHIATVERYNIWTACCCFDSTQNYKAWVESDSVACSPGVETVATTDTAGRLRISRQGSLVRMYYWHAGWIELNSALLTDENVRVSLRSQADQNSAQEASFDNLVISSSVSSGSGATYGLVVDKTGTELALNWDASCDPGDDNYAVYEGVLGDFESHAAVTCSTGGSTSWQGLPSLGSAYYIVVPFETLLQEGSYGSTSSGESRAQGLSACMDQAIALCE